LAWEYQINSREKNKTKDAAGSVLSFSRAKQQESEALTGEETGKEKQLCCMPGQLGTNTKWIITPTPPSDFANRDSHVAMNLDRDRDC
jgi:hypothetical protein